MRILSHARSAIFTLVFYQSWIMEAQKETSIRNSDFVPAEEISDLHRSHFPKHFVFGASTSSYQVEGAVNEGGRGRTIWDTYTHLPDKIQGGGTGDVAADQYHLYKEDVEFMKEINLDAYRFSIAWSRIIPDGIGPPVNLEGIAYYNRLIDALLKKGIKPYVTIFHWDLPQDLQDKLVGWINPEIVKHFAYYAEICFAYFGDRVKNWMTFNEPTHFCVDGYGTGRNPPGRTSDRTISPVGDSSTEPYLAAHNVLISHATVVEIYRAKYKPVQGGVIGWSIDCSWGEPLTNSAEDKAATERYLAFQLGWWFDPIFFGDYPAEMRENVGDRLPYFTEDEKRLLRHCVDFVGLNNYTTYWVTNYPVPSDPSQSGYWEDQGLKTTGEKDGVFIGAQAHSSWLYIVPWGLRMLIEHVWKRYKAPIYICENGMDQSNDESFPEVLQDGKRIKFHHDYLESVRRAMVNGADVRTYFAWSLLDNFEWTVGYTSRFGLLYVDYQTQKRYLKDSAKWFKKFLLHNDADPPPIA